MTIFLDGPASGQQHILPRSPGLLRMAYNDGAWRPLAGLDDEPLDEEILYVYKLARVIGKAPGKEMAAVRHNGLPQYEHYAKPQDQTMRDTALWRQWCLEEKEKTG